MYDTIKWLHVEPTTRCNAWCSFCPRNKNGYGLSDFELEDLIPKRLDTIIGKMPKLETVQFCGTLGDPCASKLINEQLKVVKKYNLNLQLHTNGSLRNKDWWANLAKLFGDKISVWFAIDGLDDTHKKYRQATDWHKIIENAKSFIEAGGHAVWQFIPFAHNEHQIRDCMRLSTSLGFARFEFIKDARYLDKAYDYQTGETTDISPWSKHNEQWSRKGKILNKTTGNIPKVKVEKKNCMHLALSSLFLNAHGVITPCCYFRKKPFIENEIENTITSGKFYTTCIDACGS